MNETITVAQSNGLTVEAFLATIIYAVLGVALMVLLVAAADKIFGFDVKKELVVDNNTSVGIVIAGIAIGIAIIIAGTIGS